MKRIFLASALVLAVGCSGDDDNNTAANNTTASGGFEGGSYTITVLDVEDGCFDGAMDTIVLPTGAARDLPEPVTMPAYADLPGTIDIKFNAPFGDQDGVAIEASGDNGVTTSGTGFTQADVDISADADGSCIAQMNVTFTLTASEPGTLTGSGDLSITAAEGASCAAFQTGPPCTVTSNLRAVKN